MSDTSAYRGSSQDTRSLAQCLVGFSKRSQGCKLRIISERFDMSAGADIADLWNELQFCHGRKDNTWCMWQRKKDIFWQLTTHEKEEKWRTTNKGTQPKSKSGTETQKYTNKKVYEQNSNQISWLFGLTNTDIFFIFYPLLHFFFICIYRFCRLLFKLQITLDLHSVAGFPSRLLHLSGCVKTCQRETSLTHPSLHSLFKEVDRSSTCEIWPC